MSLYTVARELGHSNVHLLEKTYGHVDPVRKRGRSVEFVRDQDRKKKAL